MLGWLNRRLDRLQAKAAAQRADVPSGTPQPPASGDPLALYRAGWLTEAEAAASRRLAESPQDAAALHATALLQLDRQQFRQAAETLARAVALVPDDLDAAVDLGRALGAGGRRREAEAVLDRVRQLRPEHGGVLAEDALAALARGKMDDALARMARASGSGPGIGQAHLQLADLWRQRKQAANALRHYRMAIAAHPGLAAAHANLGALLKEQGHLAEAERSLERALSLQPELAEAAFNLAMLRVGQREWHAAANLLRGYTAARPRDADGHYWLANAAMGDGDAPAARAAYQAALRVNAGHAQARWGLAMAQLPAVASSAGEQAQGIADFAASLEKLPAWFRAHPDAEGAATVGAQQPFYLAYAEGDHRQLLSRYGELCTGLMARWARKVKVPDPAPPDGRARIRLGIVSAHVHSHSVWHAVLRGWIEHLDPSRFEIHLFHTGAMRDSETEWAARKVARLHHGLGEWFEWAKAISDGRFDVMIYPEIGMDAITVRLSALRLARVQLAGWGHPITTGLPTMDGYISAQAFEPEDGASHYAESLIALPGLGCAYRPYGIAPQAPDLSGWGIGPADSLLLCAGTAFKYAPREDALWVDIARRCDPCKLVFFRKARDTLADRLAQRLRTAFDAAGADFERSVRFIPWQPQPAFFSLLQRAGAYLDTVGFSGFNTAMQAVECGTPVVAWEGRFMRGRFASAILRQLELDEWIADSHETYALRVAQLCADGAQRAAVRHAMEQRRSRLYGDRSSVDALAARLLALAGADAP